MLTGMRKNNKRVEKKIQFNSIQFNNISSIKILKKNDEVQFMYSFYDHNMTNNVGTILCRYFLISYIHLHEKGKS